MIVSMLATGNFLEISKRNMGMDESLMDKVRLKQAKSIMKEIGKMISCMDMEPIISLLGHFIWGTGLKERD